MCIFFLHLRCLWHILHSIITTRCIWPIFNIFNIDSITFREHENDMSDTFDIDLSSTKMCVCSFPIFDIFDIHSITALRCIWSIFDIDSITLKENENDISDIIDMSHILYSLQITMLIVIQSPRIRVKFDLNPWLTLNYKRVWIKT